MPSASPQPEVGSAEAASCEGRLKRLERYTRKQVRTVLRGGGEDMKRTSFLLALHTFLTYIAGAQMTNPSLFRSNDPPWLHRFERLLQEKEREWKLIGAAFHREDQNHVVIHLGSGGKKMALQVVVELTNQAAAQRFKSNGTRFILLAADVEKAMADPSFQLPASIAPDNVQPNLGDESYIWTRCGESQRTFIRLRKQNVYVEVDAPSEEVARRFAKYVID